MPAKSWRYPCGHGWGGNPTCFECSEPGIFDGCKTSGMVEHMCAYSRFFRLPPIGPHRPFADKVFEGATRPCPRCGGRANLASGLDVWKSCPRCDGEGKLWVLPPEEVEILRKSVLAILPDAAGPRRTVPGPAGEVK